MNESQTAIKRLNSAVIGRKCETPASPEFSDKPLCIRQGIMHFTCHLTDYKTIMFIKIIINIIMGDAKTGDHFCKL